MRKINNGIGNLKNGIRFKTQENCTLVWSLVGEAKKKIEWREDYWRKFAKRRAARRSQSLGAKGEKKFELSKMKGGYRYPPRKSLSSPDLSSLLAKSTQCG